MGFAVNLSLRVENADQLTFSGGLFRVASDKVAAMELEFFLYTSDKTHIVTKMT